jgi:hypothetical protein
MSEWYRSVLMRRAIVPGAVALCITFLLPACVSVEKTGDKGEPPPSMATVSLQSEPMDADVSIDGDFRGTTPFSVKLSAGTHTIEMRRDGFKPWSRELVVVGGDDTRVKAILVPIAQ